MAKGSRIHKVIVDTNFLIDVARFKIDMDSIEELLSGRYKLVMPKAVEGELKKMKSKHAKVAIKLTKLRNVKSVKNPSGVKNTDNIIITLAKQLHKKSRIAVATNDAKLRKRLKGLGIKTIYLRARKHLEIS